MAQEAIVALDVGGSYALPPAGGTGIASTYANGGLRLFGTFGSGGFFHAIGSGGLALNQDGASWASAQAGGGWLQPISRHASVGIAAVGEAFTVGDPVPYRAAYAAAEPELRFVSGGTAVRLSAYGGLGSSEVTAIRTVVRDTRFGPRRYEVGTVVSSDLWAWGGRAEVGQQLGALKLLVAVEGYDSPQGTYAVGRLGLEVHARSGVFYAEGAIWDTPYGEELTMVAGLRVITGRESSFQASGGRYGPDPLLDSPAAGGLGASASLQLARFGPQPDLTWTVLEGAEQTLVLTLRVRGAAVVECAGDFTDWSRIPMLTDGDVWRIALPIAAGAYHFGFFVDGEWYVPPEAPGLAEDEWGEVQATIIVDDPVSIPDVTP